LRVSAPDEERRIVATEPKDETTSAGVVTVALVDDHQMVRQGLATWLAVACSRIDVLATASTVDELRRTAGWGARVVLLDLYLDDDSAVEDNLAALHAAGSQVAVISAHVEPEVVYRAVAAGATGYVPKGASAEEMLAAVHATAAGEAFMTQDLAAALLAHQPLARPHLSGQELRTLQWYAGGMKMASVARRLDVSPGAVKSYVDRIRAKYAKVGRPAPTKIDLYRRAVEDGHLPEQ
jgi:two-component system nitrate/nitrite response regulator NarL